MQDGRVKHGHDGFNFVMRGLDPRICRSPEMAGSSPAFLNLNHC